MHRLHSRPNCDCRETLGVSQERPCLIRTVRKLKRPSEAAGIPLGILISILHAGGSCRYGGCSGPVASQSDDHGPSGNRDVRCSEFGIMSLESV